VCGSYSPVLPSSNAAQDTLHSGRELSLLLSILLEVIHHVGHAHVIGVAPSLVAAAPAIEVGLSAFRATAASEGDFSLLAMLVYVADEYPTLKTRAGTLQAGVVSLYGVVVILSRWVRVGCARLCGVHRF